MSKAKAWSKATPEQRAIHRRRCQEAGQTRKIINFVNGSYEGELSFIREHRQVLTMLFEIEQEYGIKPEELMKFSLLTKDHHPLTENQAREWWEMAVEKIPAEEIYQRLFSNAV